MESAGKRKAVKSDFNNGTTFKSTSEISDIALGITSPLSESHEDCCFKENVNTNKSETPKLSMEPLQMKRKKRGGGNNFRKSLAWDKAFFTDEGVLDPLELAIISSASCRGLPVTDEDTIGSSQLQVESCDIQKPKSYPLKELSGEDLGVDGRSGILLLKSYSPSSNMTSDQVFTQFDPKSRSKCANSSQPLASLSSSSSSSSSSSLKRLANVNSVKASAKEPKLPKKFICSKPGFTSVRKTKSSILGANIVKHNQIAQPGRISSQSIKNTQKSSVSSSFRPTCHPEQISDLSVKRHSSINMSPLLGSKTYDSVSRSISACTTPLRPLHSSDCQHQSRTLASPVSQNPQDSGIVTHSYQNHTMKPSGLRMPSPSLSFFHQPKSSALNTLSARETKNIDVCGSQKPGNLSAYDTSEEITEVTNISIENKSDRSTAIFSRPQVLVPTTANAVLSKALNVKETEKKNMVVDCETSQRSRSYEVVIIDEATLSKGKSHLLETRLTSLETIAKQTNELHGSEAKNPTGEQCEQPNTSKFSILYHDFNFGTYHDEETDPNGQDSLSLQNGWNDACKSDHHEPCMKQNDELECPLSENFKMNDINKLDGKMEKRAIEVVELPQPYRSPSDEVENFEALKHLQVANKVLDPVSHQDAIILKEPDSVDVIIDKLSSRGADGPDSVFDSTISHCKNNIDPHSEFVDDAIKSGQYMMEKDVCPRIDQGMPRNSEFHTNTNTRLMAEDICGNNWETSSQILKQGASHIDNRINMLVQSPESNTLTECYLEHSELHDVKSTDKIISDSIDDLHFPDLLQSGGTVSGVPADQSGFIPISDPNLIEVSTRDSISICESRPIWNNDVTESTLAPSCKSKDFCNKEIHAPILRENAIPFSDEWLSAIEAAGEEILTKKSGAVQNSPPDKYLQEPSPWSPVKKKNNQIGPYDCTKFSNNLH